MAQQNPRSLKHEYELYVENEIENYKESVTRSAILKIGDEAAASLRAGEQFAMDELLLWAEVDRIIRKRLRIPAYGTWRRKRLKMLEEYRRPEHWGIRPDGVLAREVHPPLAQFVCGLPQFIASGFRGLAPPPKVRSIARRKPL